MSPNSRIKDPRAFSLFVALLLCILVSQGLMARAIQFDYSQASLPLALIVAGVAVALLLLGQRVPDMLPAGETAPAADAEAATMPVMGFVILYSIEQNWRAIGLAISIMLTAGVLRRLPLMSSADSYSREVLLWVCACVLFLLAMAPRFTWQADWRLWWRTHHQEALTISIIVLLAFVIRIWHIGTIPFTLSGDEGSQGLEAIRVMEGKLRNPFTTGWLGVPTMSFFYNSFSIRLFGRSVGALRLPWVILGTVTVPITFLLVRRLKGTPLALITAALLATYHYHIHFSRLGSNQVADPFFMPLALFFLIRSLDGDIRLDWALAGMVTGLALYFYAGARLTPVVIMAVLAYVFIRDPRRFWRQHGPGILVALGAFLIVGAPMIQYARRFPNDFNARLNQVGIIQSGWLEQAVEARGESVAAVLFDQFQRAALAFNYYPDRTVWYGLRQPLLNPFFGVLFLLGLGYGTLRLWGRLGDRRLAPMVAWWWGGMLLGGMLTESPPSSQRLITLSVPVCFFIALTLWELVQLAQKGIVRFPGKVLLGVMVLLFSLSSLVTYFLDYSPQRIYGGPYAEMATEIAPVLNELTPDHRIYFVGAPWVYWGLATLPYLVPDADAVDVTGPLSDLFALGEDKSPQKNAVFVIIPERLEELDLVQDEFPQGSRSDYYSPVDRRMMVTLYKAS